MKTRKMKTSINLKTRKMKNKYLKLAMMAAVMLSASIGFAQTTDATDGSLNNVFGTGQSIKVIDNKGTIKYLQTNNGITSITSSSGGSKTTTTWQLGGALVANTDIATGDQEFKLTIGGAGTQGSFIIDGVETVTVGAALTTVDGQLATGTSPVGYTFLVRDEQTGKTKKLLASGLITGIRTEFLIGDDGDGTLSPAELATDITADVDINVAGMPAITAGTNDFKLSVYRNGVKLRFGSDFSVVAGTTDFDVRLPTAGTTMFAGDYIEIQYLK